VPTTEISTVSTEIDESLIEPRLLPILRLMYEGVTFSQASRDQGHLPQTAWKWVQRDQHSRRAYGDARVRLASALADDTIRMADDAQPDEDPVRRAQLQVGSRQWLAAKLDPATYGDHAAERSGAGGDGQQRVTIALTQVFGIVRGKAALGVDSEALALQMGIANEENARIVDEKP
jgi:hypothetical protein